MTIKLFGVNVAKEIASAMGSGLLSAKLIKVTSSTSSTDSTSGDTSENTYPCRGMLEDYTDRQVDGTIVMTGDRKVLLLGGTLSSSVVPEPNDKIYIESETYNVVRVGRDPAAATYTCQVRV